MIFEDAANLYQRAEAILEKSLPQNHPEIGKAISGLVDVYRLEGRWQESAALYQRAPDSLAHAWGSESPQLLGPLESYEVVLRELKEYAAAEKVEVRSTKIRVVEALRSSK